MLCKHDEQGFRGKARFERKGVAGKGLTRLVNPPKQELLRDSEISDEAPIAAGVHLNVVHIFTSDDYVRLVPQRENG